MKLGYFLVYVIPAIIFGLLELLFLRSDFFHIAFILILLITNLSFWFFSFLAKEKKRWWNFSVLPTLFVATLVIYISILTNRNLVHFLFFSTAFFLYHYFKNTFYLFNKSDKYTNFFLENVSSYGGFLVVFFTAASAYALRLYLGISFKYLILGFTLVVLLIIYEVFWANKIKIKEKGFYIPLICLILVEIACAIYYFPIHYNAIGLILAICYYIIIGLMRVSLRSSLNKVNIKFYLFFGFGSILLILFTAKWF